MTSLAAWFGVHTGAIGSLYIVSDSRIVWPNSSDIWDYGRKVYTSPASGDILGFYGDVLLPSMLLPVFAESPIFRDEETSHARHELVNELFIDHFAHLPRGRRGTFGILHGSRQGIGDAAQVFLWHTGWQISGGWFDNEEVLSASGPSGLQISLGSGEISTGNYVRYARAELGFHSRSVFTGFCDALASGLEESVGGAPQLVGLYRQGAAMHFGISYGGSRYFRGLPITSVPQLDIQWKNELFENCDPMTGRLKEGEQAQPRLGVVHG